MQESQSQSQTQQQQQHQSTHGFLDKLKARLDRNGGAGRSGQNSRGGSFTATGAVVSVNVYDMLWLNVYTNSFGIGVYHTGVEVHGIEYCYGGHPFEYSGIFAMVPRDSEILGPNYSYKMTINMGWTDFTESDISLILEDMGPQYRGDQYHLLHRNCNHFSDEFVQVLCGASLPKWINRLATVGAKLPFLERSIPKIWLTPRPLEEFDATHSERSNTNVDLGTCSCPLLAPTDENRNDESPGSSHSNIFLRVPSTFQRRLNVLDRPRSSISFRGRVNRPREVSIHPSGSLMTLAESLDTGFNVRSVSTAGLPHTSSRRYSAHPRLREGDSEVNSRGRHNLPKSISNTPSKPKVECGIQVDHTIPSLVIDEPRPVVKRRESFLNRLSVPIVASFHSRRPSSGHNGSEQNSPSCRTLSSISSQEGLFLNVSPRGTTPTNHPAGSRRKCPQPLADSGTARKLDSTVRDQPVAHRLRSPSGHKLSKRSPTACAPSPETTRTNCAHNLTTGLLTRLQNLCGTTQLHDSIHSSPVFDSDTNSLANSAF